MSICPPLKLHWKKLFYTSIWRMDFRELKKVNIIIDQNEEVIFASRQIEANTKKL